MLAVKPVPASAGCTSKIIYDDPLVRLLGKTAYHLLGPYLHTYIKAPKKGSLACKQH